MSDSVHDQFPLPHALLTEIREIVTSASRVLVLSGAGISAESGIPTFRSGSMGLWKQADLMRMATREGFLSDPHRVWAWYEERRTAIQRTAPNAGHVAIADLSRAGKEAVVVTQNVDDLHERAGSPRVLHLHGEIATARCVECSRPFPREGDSAAPQGSDSLAPSCPQCGDWVRPNVVWFGESLSGAVWREALQLCEWCDLAIVVGTSGLVQPAASLPKEIRDRGTAVIVQVNPEPTELDNWSDFSLRATAAQALPLILASADGQGF
jgi:NAD-dependent deacetylase